MNTEEQTIIKPNTEEKVKNPKRVAQGKRLAEISKAAKARKRSEQQNEETSGFSQLPDLSTSMTMIGLATGVIGTYIAWKNLKQDQVKNHLPTAPATTPTSTSPKIKYNNLDDEDI